MSCRAVQRAQRRSLVVRAVDPAFSAAAEVWSALGAAAVASASLYGLAKVIREVGSTL